MGNLVANLTYPARTQAIDTFKDLMNLPDHTSVVKLNIYQQRIMEIMNETTDPILKVNPDIVAVGGIPN